VITISKYDFSEVRLSGISREIKKNLNNHTKNRFAYLEMEYWKQVILSD
jgi:hypothetical protein